MVCGLSAGRALCDSWDVRFLGRCCCSLVRFLLFFRGGGATGMIADRSIFFGSSGVTRMTVTVVVIMFELTGALTYILPTMVSPVSCSDHPSCQPS